MPADIKSKQLFLVGEFFVVAPRSNNALPRRCRVSFFIEQRNLADGPIAQRGRGAGKRLVDAGKKLRTVAPTKSNAPALIKLSNILRLAIRVPIHPQKYSSDVYSTARSRSCIDISIATSPH